jgi:Spy/CpxP family protein refolding chaperone
MQAMPMIDGMLRAFRHLDLSDEQKENVKATVRGLREDIRPLMSQARELHKQMGEQVRAAEYDAGAVAALADQEGDLLAERIKLTAAAMSQARSYLTGEQLEQLAAMAEKRKQRGKARGGKKGGKGQKPQTEES